jgi:hypothetical protein
VVDYYVVFCSMTVLYRECCFSDHFYRLNAGMMCAVLPIEHR